ncbi:hypothetical protein DD570_31185 [Klebsiella pneumoniae]|nr:hypothetical protein DD570_31185 [Klebsiella pneumoniae]
MDSLWKRCLKGFLSTLPPSEFLSSPTRPYVFAGLDEFLMSWCWLKLLWQPLLQLIALLDVQATLKLYL